MRNKFLSTIFRTMIKLAFVIGAWWFFISGIWGHDITLGTFDHIFRCFTILCCLSRISYVFGKGFNKTGKGSVKHLLMQVFACILGVVVGHYLHAYVIKPVLVFLGKLIGGLIVICVGLYLVLAPALAASAQAASLAGMGTSTVSDMIRRGDLKLDASQHRLKNELYRQTGIDYEEEHSRYEEDKRRHGWK